MGSVGSSRKATQPKERGGGRKQDTVCKEDGAIVREEKDNVGSFSYCGVTSIWPRPKALQYSSTRSAVLYGRRPRARLKKKYSQLESDLLLPNDEATYYFIYFGVQIRRSFMLHTIESRGEGERGGQLRPVMSVWDRNMVMLNPPPLPRQRRSCCHGPSGRM